MLHWYEVASAGPQRPARPLDQAAGELLSRLCETLGVDRFEIREPELWIPESEWPGPLYFDGRIVEVAEALDLVASMLRTHEFWCRLVAAGLEIHVGDDVVYAGLERDLTPVASGADGVELRVERIKTSPYLCDPDEPSPYPSVAAGLWTEIGRALGEGTKPMLLLRQWAAGLGGERWYMVRSAADLAWARADFVPRSIFAVFDGSTWTDLKTFLSRSNPDAIVFGNLRFLQRTSTGSPRLTAREASDWADAQRLAAPTADGWVFSWPPSDADVRHAAEPDEDGTVRTRARFG